MEEYIILKLTNLTAEQRNWIENNMNPTVESICEFINCPPEKSDICRCDGCMFDGVGPTIELVEE